MSHVIDTPFLSQAPHDVGGWVACLQQREIPVLASTIGVIAELSANEDAVDAHLLANRLGDDPLMLLKLLKHVAERQLHR